MSVNYFIIFLLLLLLEMDYRWREFLTRVCRRQRRISLRDTRIINPRERALCQAYEPLKALNS